MRILGLIAVVGICLASCGGKAQEGDTKTESAKVDTVAASPAKSEIAAVVKMDPVCEMPFDTSWTEQTVYNNDTIKFCSDNCKKAFLARPEKYIKKN
jgi:YHS domain-containing protein